MISICNLFFVGVFMLTDLQFACVFHVNLSYVLNK